MHYGDTWYAYSPDFQVLLQVGQDKDLVQSVASNYIKTVFDRYYHKDDYPEAERVYKIPSESAIFDVTWRTKDYLRVNNLSLDVYYKNVEVFVEYDVSSHSSHPQTWGWGFVEG